MLVWMSDLSSSRRKTIVWPEPAAGVDLVDPQLDRVDLTAGRLGVLPGLGDRAADQHLVVRTMAGPARADAEHEEGRESSSESQHCRCLHPQSPIGRGPFGSSRSRNYLR